MSRNIRASRIWRTSPSIKPGENTVATRSVRSTSTTAQGFAWRAHQLNRAVSPELARHVLFHVILVRPLMRSLTLFTIVFSALCGVLPTNSCVAELAPARVCCVMLERSADAPRAAMPRGVVRVSLSVATFAINHPRSHR